MLGLRRKLIQLAQRIQVDISQVVHNRRVQGRLQAGSALALLVGLLLSVTLVSGILSSFESRLADFLYQPTRPTGQVVLIAIDDASLAEIGPWPWPRAVFAELTDTLARAGPRAVAFDILLADPSPDDSALAAALGRLPNLVQPVIGVDATRFPDQLNSFPRFNTVLGPASTLQILDSHLAHTMIVPDADGVVRRIPLAIVKSGQHYPALGLAVLGLAEQRSASLQIRAGTVAFGNLRLPVDVNGQMLLLFSSPGERQVVSFADVLHNRISPELLRDKVVLIGATSSAASENYATPLSLGGRRAYPAEIEADLVETLLGKHFLVQQDRLTEIVMILLMALLAGATLPHVHPLSGAGLIILYFLAYLGYAFREFQAGILVQPLYPGLALFGTFACTMTYRYFAEERPRALLGHVLGRHVAPGALNRVLSSDDAGAVALAGLRRQVTVLCVELHEFTAITQSLAAAATIDLMNQYITLVTGVVFRHGGTIVKQLGNTVLAVWNLPLPQIDHARSAVHAALEIREELPQLGEKQPKELNIRVGLGIATGKVVAGRVGTGALAEYTIIGEIVTIADRLAQRRDGTVFLNAAAQEQIGDEFQTREVKPIRLRRKTDPVGVWEIWEPSTAQSPVEAPVEPVRMRD